MCRHERCAKVCRSPKIETIAFEDDSNSRLSLSGPFAHQGYQEGYEPLAHALDEQMLATDYDVPSTACRSRVQHSPQASPRSESDTQMFRRRRPRPTRAVTSPSQPCRLSKRGQTGRRRPSDQQNPRSIAPKEEKMSRAGGTAFPCALQTYGCTATFASKNEWKRHVATQHLQLESWRCEWCPEGKPKDFNRKDLFVQHVRRMHAEAILPFRTSNTNSKRSAKDTPQDQAALAAASDRCYRRLRLPPDESRCLLCDEHFHGPRAWDERMEHLGRHLEQVKKGAEAAVDTVGWPADSGTHEWLVKEKIVVPVGERYVLADKTTV